MKFTNKHNLPEPLARALARDTYSRGAAHRSVTDIIGSPRITLLKAQHKEDIEIDVIDRLWSVWGTVTHSIIERGSEGAGDEYLPEERLFLEVLGWTISGAIDLQQVNNLYRLFDWKTCPVYGVMNTKPEWERQLNVYAYLVRITKGVEVESLHVGAIMRDWSAAKAKRDSSYPVVPIQIVDIPLWSAETQADYVYERVRMHQEAHRSAEWGEPLPECTPEECWERTSSYAVSKPNAKRALRVFGDRRSADDFAAGQSGPMSIQCRPGARIRCESYCEVSPFCDQWSAWQAANQKSDELG